MGKADRIQGPAIQRLARLSRLVAVSGCSGTSAVSRIASARSWSGRALDWPMARFRFVAVDFCVRSAYFV